MSIENILFWVALLIFISVISSKLSNKFAIPALLVFLAIGMLAGSEGIGGIYFNNPNLAKSIGIIALIFIIFSGGIDTKWEDIRPIIGAGIVLSTAGVLLTALIIGFFAVYILNFSILEGMLLGSIVSSTDAAAVFTILRSKRISLQKPLKPLLELESGSNDPMAVFLTLGFISVMTVKDMSILNLVPRFILDMSIGAVIGYIMAKIIIFLIKNMKLEYEGLYPVVMISLVLFTYVIAFFLKGNGFLAVYLAGLLISRADFPNKRSIMRFHNGIAWLMQITMFITLGLLVFPSHIVPLIGPGLLITFLLMLVARPVSVFLCLLPFKINFRQKILLSWVGLRGAVPIILATFPFTANISHADTIFNIVFFIVIASVFIQGTSIPFVSKILNLAAPLIEKRLYPLEFEKTETFDAELTDVLVPYDSHAVGKMISELGVPDKCLIVLISREGKFIIPYGSSVIENGDVLLVLANKEDLVSFQQILAQLKEKQD